MSVHLVTALHAAITPDAFHTAFPGPGLFILEDTDLTMMGAEPTALIRASRAAATDPFAPLRQHLGRAPTFDPQFPFPFRAGLVGYAGYECGQLLERLPCVARPSLGMPDLAFGLHNWVIGTRGDKSWLSIVANSTAEAASTRDHVLSRLVRSESSDQAPLPRSARATTKLDRASYLERVSRAKEHILSGDAFEICLTNAFDVPFDRAAAWPLYQALRRANPAPFSAFQELPEGVIVSSSPERFLSLSEDRVAETRPIKGTRPRGATPEEDARIIAELRDSEKDRAENAMIVDLSRNDLGRVCRIGSITTPELYAVETYATVHQLVSTIRGSLAPEHDAIDLLRACFPPGSMTGAPKIEAMRILEHLEPVERGPYAGALGWIDLGGAMDLSVIIRTAVISAGIARFAAGGAVTADSDPAAEYEEMLQKTRAIRALLVDEPSGPK